MKTRDAERFTFSVKDTALSCVREWITSGKSVQKNVKNFPSARKIMTTVP